MYLPRAFEVSDRDEIFSFIAQNRFGQMISHFEGRPCSNHLPFLVSEGRLRLVSHLARANPQWRGADGQQVLVTFQGPHGYISPAWYEQPGVPTWNYQAVHVYGECTTFEEPERLKGLLAKLVEKYEAASEEPWLPRYPDQLPFKLLCRADERWLPRYPDQLLEAIVGVEIEITEIQCKYKLSQNRSDNDRRRVIEALKRQGLQSLAEAMSKQQ